MENTLTWKKIIILGVLLVTPFALAQCGDSGGNSVASSTVGPIGPTFPGKYYFDATVTPHTIDNEGTVAVVVRVFDEKGFPASGVATSVVGPKTAGAGSTGSNGIVTFTLTVSGTAGGITYLTVAVENSALTIPVQIRAITAPSTS